jgi:hypothetical protein
MKAKDIEWCDILICVRGAYPESVKIVQAAKKAGRLVIYYLDDDLKHIPRGTEGGFTDATVKQNIEAMDNCLASSDVLWCVNPLVAENYGNGLRTVCVPASVKLPDAFPLKDANVVKILFAGTTGHTKTVRAYVSPALRRLCDEYGDGISLLFIGANPGLYELPQVEYREWIDDYDEYERAVINGGFHIGIAVIEASAFFQCKYYNKYLEYTKIGAAGVYTNSKPYTLCVREGVNGYLCENTPDGWYNALKQAIDNANDDTVFNNAAAHLKATHSPEILSRRIAEEIPELLTCRSDKTVKVKLRLLGLSYCLSVIKALWQTNKRLFIFLFIGLAARKIFRMIIRKFKRRNIIDS